MPPKQKSVSTTRKPSVQNIRSNNTKNNHNIIKPNKSKTLPNIFTIKHINGTPLLIENNYQHVPLEENEEKLTYTSAQNLSNPNPLLIPIKKKNKKEFIFYGFNINDIKSRPIVQNKISFYNIDYNTLKSNEEIVKIINNKLEITTTQFKRYFENYVFFKIIQYNNVLTGNSRSREQVATTGAGLDDLQIINITHYLYDYMNIFIPKKIENNISLKKIYLITLFLKNILHQIEPHSQIERFIRQKHIIDDTRYDPYINALHVIYEKRIYTQEELNELFNSNNNENKKMIRSNNDKKVYQTVFNYLILFKQFLDHIYHISSRLIRYKEIYTSTLRAHKKSIIQKIYEYANSMINTIVTYCKRGNTPQCIYYRGYGYETPEGSVEGTPEGSVEGTPEGSVEGTPEGSVEGSIEGTPEGSVAEPEVEENNGQSEKDEIEELRFITCYQNIRDLSTNFTNFRFLDNHEIIKNENHIYNNIFCLYSHEDFGKYIVSNPEENDKKEIFRNIFLFMPYVLFYYYKTIIYFIEENKKEMIRNRGIGAGAGAGSAFKNQQTITPLLINYILTFLSISFKICIIYKYLIENIELLFNQGENINDDFFSTNIYKINKIMYKTLKDLYYFIYEQNGQNFIRRNKFGTNLIQINNLYIEIQQIKKNLIPIYQQKGLNIRNYNYITSVLPNFNNRNKETTYRMINEENAILRNTIIDLRRKGIRLNNVQTKLTPKYEMLKRREKNINFKRISFNELNRNNNNHIFFRKMLNNEKNHLENPLQKYYNHFSKSKI